MRFAFTRENIWKGLILFGFFSLAGIISALPFWFYAAKYGKYDSPYAIILQVMAEWYLWILFVPLIYWISKTFRIQSQSLLKDISVNFLLSLLIIFGKTFLDKMLQVNFWNTDPKQDQWMNVIFYTIFSPKTFMQFLTYWLFVMFIYMMQYYRELQERKIESSQLETQLAQAHLSALRMQIQPHFLFNTLNSILSLLRKDVNASEEMIINLGDMLRYSLSTTNMQEVTLREEIDFLKHYLDIEKIRFQDRLTTEFQISRDTLDAWVPSMFLQPIVENSIRHGISKKIDPGKIIIRSQRFEDVLRVFVLDTGEGFIRKHVEEGIGLSNTRKRLNKLYGSSFTFQIGRTDNNETIVTISIPYLEKK